MGTDEIIQTTDAEIGINKHNVGRIAERIVSNELGFRGFRVSDLNKEGTSANADLLAARNGKTWQIQVKGATEDDGWWFGYGYCTEAIIAGKGKEEGRIFNRGSTSSFYRAEIVVLVSVKSPTKYSCLVLPVETAEKAAQENLDREFRTKKKDGKPKKPGKVWISPDYILNTKDASRERSFKVEQALLVPHRDNWDIFDS
jgi:hypothetical protein